MSVAFLSLGSNMGDRLSLIQQAVSMLGLDNNIQIAATSSFYETEPYGKSDQPWFVNAVVAIRTELSPIELLRACQNVEAKLGRDRKKEERWGKRPIDIDILFYDNLVFSNEILTIPHKEVHKRAFALVPMLEIKSSYVHPVLGKNILELHEALEDPEDVFLYGTISGSNAIWKKLQ